MYTDFDFLLGKWRVFNNRLNSWLCDCEEWTEFESRHIEQRHSSGHGNFAHHYYAIDNTLHERCIARIYDKNYDYWKINRMDTMSTLMIKPLQGTFWNNKGSFLSNGVLNGEKVLVWAEWTKICSTYAYWEQALSKDFGKTWETSWVMEFFRD
jgi:hypothetical protein